MSCSCAYAPALDRTTVARRGSIACVAALVVAFTVGHVALAGSPTDRKTSIVRADGSDAGASVQPTMIDLESITTMRVRPGVGVIENAAGSTAAAAGGAFCGIDTATVTHTDSTYQAGQYWLQVGFAENEILAAEYTLTADDFPVTLRQIDFMLAQSSTTVTTTTQFTVIIWDGPPVLGIQAGSFSSPDDFPAVVMPPGPQGTHVQIQIDPEDPNQVVIGNLTGLNTFTVGIQIDVLNNPPVDPCSPTNEELVQMLLTNAFPVVDLSGVWSPTGNWIDALFCLNGLCPEGWSTFEDFPLGCTPTGDWVMQACYDDPQVTTRGACCAPQIGCNNDTLNIVCEGLGGVFFEEQLCADVTCPDPTGACCAFGTCLPDRTAEACALSAPSSYLGDASVCGNQGACCMPDGSCESAFEGCCASDGGTFQGDGTLCGSVSCPQPTGACCLPIGCIDNLLQLNCEAGGTGTWMGPHTTCTPDPCVIAIDSSSPPHGAIDGRQPTDETGANPAGWDTVMLTFNGDTAGLTPGDFTISSGGAAAPSVIGVTPSGINATLTFDTFIPPGEWTMITHDPSGTSACLGYLPGDVNGDEISDPGDIIGVIDCINMVAVPACELYQCDTDRSGTCDPSDIIRVIDLLNGANAYTPWFGVALPVSPCGP